MAICINGQTWRSDDTHGLCFVKVGQNRSDVPHMSWPPPNWIREIRLIEWYNLAESDIHVFVTTFCRGIYPCGYLSSRKIVIPCWSKTCDIHLLQIIMVKLPDCPFYPLWKEISICMRIYHLSEYSVSSISYFLLPSNSSLSRKYAFRISISIFFCNNWYDYLQFLVSSHILPNSLTFWVLCCKQLGMIYRPLSFLYFLFC